MNKSTIITIIALLVIGGGVFIMTRSNKNDAAVNTAVQSSSTALVQASDSPLNDEVSATTTAKAQVYTLAQVAEHNVETDCWMAIERRVYDVTQFIPRHPGGKAILGGCGKDATLLFNERPTNDKGPHPAQAKQLLQSFEIGELAK